MKRIYLMLMGAFIGHFAYSQCSTQTLQSNGCVCKDGSNDCALLPDLNLSWFALETYMAGPTEYSQSGNGANNGRLRITGSTPNIGHGSFTVLGSNSFVCGTDTMVGSPGTCPDGNPPRQLIVQRVYYKNTGGTMTYQDRWAGAMTYHPTHGHNHVDDWVAFTLRIEDPNEPDPRNWPIIGNGAKIGFCLMDYGTCSYYNGHCRDDNTTYQQGNVLLNGDFPNYGLGGGNYGCSPTIQGISSGYTDIYSENLDGMWITIPPGTCNGDYWIVGVVDPNDNFLEEDETNNWTAIPFTLTQQTNGSFEASISHGNQLTICEGDSLQLTATSGLSYTWSNGATTQSIYVKDPDTYTVTVTSICGTDETAPVTIEVLSRPEEPAAADQAICGGETLSLTATGTEVHWFDESMAEIGVGNSINVENVMASTVFYAQEHYSVDATVGNVGKLDNSDGGFYSNATASLVFHVYAPSILKSVKVYAEESGEVTIKLKDNLGQLITQKIVTVAEGEHRVYLNFELAVGTGFYLEASGASMPNMYRSNAGIEYPYELAGFVSIVAPTTYNYFYDWEIITSGAFCPSDLTAVNVAVDCFLGIDEMNLNYLLNIYPNPAKNEFNIDFTLTETANVKLEVFNIIGASVLSKELGQVNSIHETVDATKLQSGVYLVNITVSNKSYTRKVVIQ